MRSASSHLLRSEPENCARPSLMPASRPTSLTPPSGERVEIERGPVVGAGELHGGDPTRPDDVVDFVVTLVEHPGHLHPPMDVPVAVEARATHVLSDREDDVAAGTPDFVRQLHTGGRRADHHHATLGELLRVAVLHRRQRRHLRRYGRRIVGHVRTVERAAGQDDGRTRPFPFVGGDPVLATARRSEVTVVPHITGAAIALA